MRTFMVHSYKGGTGKSLFSINMANILSDKFDKKTLLVESDFSMPSYTNIFNKYSPDIFFNDYLDQSDRELASYIYPDEKNKLGIIYCNPSFNPKDKIFSTDVSWFNDKLEQLRHDFSQLDYEFIIFDLAPGKNLFTINAVVLSDDIFVLIRPDYASITHTIRVFQDFYRYADLMTNKQIRIYFNQIPKDKRMDTLIRKWSQEVNIRLDNIGSIDTIYFEPVTGYNVASNQIILPDEDPLYMFLKNQIKDLL